MGCLASIRDVVPRIEEESLPVVVDTAATLSEDPLVLLAERFHQVARQLRDRRAGRSPLIIQDEYDVQYLLHALLRIFYNDIRPEETAPSLAGAAARMDIFQARCP
jgi:hypothetical protein